MSSIKQRAKYGNFSSEFSSSAISLTLLLFYISLMFSASVIGDIFLCIVVASLFLVRPERIIETRSALMLIGVLIILIGQLWLYKGGGFYTNVSESRFREMLTVGTYIVSGNVNVSRFVKFVIYLGISIKLSLVSKKRINRTSRLAVYILLILLFLQILFTTIFGPEFNFRLFQNFIEGQALTAGHILSHRFHFGFYEPSAASLFFGIIVFLGFSDKSIIWSYMLLAVISIITESISSIVVFTVLYFSPIILFSAFSGVFLLFFKVLNFNPQDFFFLRSFYDRYPIVNFDNLRWIFFGVDFGNIYSFYPIFGILVDRKSVV